MRKPSCYPNHCHTCESIHCYEEVTCPRCGELNWVCKYDDLPMCNHCNWDLDEDFDPADYEEEDSDGSVILHGLFDALLDINRALVDGGAV